MPTLENEHKTDALSDQDLAKKVLNDHSSNTYNIQSKYPTETIALPSKGLVYPKESPLSSGEVEMRYLTAKDEDILTSRNLINKGANILFDRLLKSILVTKFDINELIEGDKEALLVAARVLSYGKDYKVSITDPGDEFNTMEVSIDLTKDIVDKEIDDWSIFQNKNEFEFDLPRSGVKVTACIPTHGSTIKYESELKGLKKSGVNLEVTPDNTLYLETIVKSVNGSTSKSDIRKFVGDMPILDSRELKSFISNISPGLDWSQEITSESTGETKTVEIYPDVDFFWSGLRK